MLLVGVFHHCLDLGQCLVAGFSRQHVHAYAYRTSGREYFARGLGDAFGRVAVAQPAVAVGYRYLLGDP
ncbi:hypothetical protein D3C75_1320840 [compost metagenome]